MFIKVYSLKIMYKKVYFEKQNTVFIDYDIAC